MTALSTSTRLDDLPSAVARPSTEPISVKPAPLDLRDARGARRATRGATFFELMLAVLIISTTLVASTSSMRTSSEVYHYFADGQHEALMLAQEIHEAAKLLPWVAAPGAEAAFGSDVYDLWDLDGKEYDPPRSAEHDVIISHLGWSQKVEIRVVDMENPEVEVDPATFEGETLVEIKVSIFQGELEVDSVGWWLTEPTGA
jgi:hypothetical protein